MMEMISAQKKQKEKQGKGSDEVPTRTTIPPFVIRVSKALQRGKQAKKKKQKKSITKKTSKKPITTVLPPPPPDITNPPTVLSETPSVGSTTVPAPPPVNRDREVLANFG